MKQDLIRLATKYREAAANEANIEVRELLLQHATDIEAIVRQWTI